MDVGGSHKVQVGGCVCLSDQVRVGGWVSEWVSWLVSQGMVGPVGCG